MVKIEVRVENEEDWNFEWLSDGDGKYHMAVF